MAINKVVYGDEVLLDLTEDTVTSETLGKGMTAHDKTGNLIIGTMVDNYEDIGEELADYTSLNEELAAVIDSLPNAGGGSQGGEDVTEETNAYTAKLASLETAVAALETELAGKASGSGGGGDGGVETYTLVLNQPDGEIVTIVDYVSYENGEYQYHSDTIQQEGTLYFDNAVLKTPFRIYVGNWGEVHLKSSISYVLMKDYTADYTQQFPDSKTLLPLSSDNGQIIVDCTIDD